METGKMIAYFGSYAGKQAPGIHVYAWDEQEGTLSAVDAIPGLINPTFMAVSQRQGLLYSYTQADEGQDSGAVLTFRIDPATGTLAPAGQALSLDKSATHINLDHAEQFALTVSYSEGTVNLFPVQGNGEVGQLADKARHEGSSVVAKRQDSAHPHSVYTDPSDRFVIVPDLGMDKIVVYRLDSEQGKLQPHDEVAMEPGSGPRHFAFHPNGRHAYVINELSSTVTAFVYDGDAGKLQPVQTISTLPDDFAGESICAEVQISPCGSYLYGSNRGHDSLAVFAVDPESGVLSAVQTISTGGAHPRHFSLTPSGGYLLAANKDSDSVVVFKVDRDSGRLTPNGQSISLPQPTCVRFYRLP
ncbi:lactonase family protein [Paenibacillus doosanensis]|uniref:lactonase family protein n=1 Tax=Paenibacillus doosanensis TaxID=1229154 RepID=UPI0021806B5A|nr:lactonase family protein [Paenibacillus doosanensis]MCS7463484.1 lactonase family protein [Paenibacillus doosanensis]